MNKTIKYLLFISILQSLTLRQVNAQFSEVSEDLGIQNYSNELLSGGVAFFDYNNDGFEDIYVVGGSRGEKVYENNGRGGFIDVTQKLGINKLPNVKIMGVISSDFDNDGYTDILLTTESGRRCYLLWNEGGEAFTETGFDSGTDFLQSFYGSSAASSDFDLDGDLDIYICNYDINGRDYLFENIGNRIFIDSSDLLSDLAKGTALAVVFSDYDNDSDSDILVGNDFGFEIIPNTLFKNNYPEKSFTEVGANTSWAIGINSMGIAVGDYDNDLDNDYYITDIGANHFFENNNGSLEENTSLLELDLSSTTSWGTLFLDYDNDGDEDLFVANGTLGIENEISDQPDALFENRAGSFLNVAAELEIASPKISRGVAKGDFNNDGLTDLLVGLTSQIDDINNEGPLLYKNNSGGKNWIKLLLKGSESNRDAFGSKIYLYSGDLLLFKEIYGGGSYLSSNSNSHIFGLDNNSIVDKIEIIWPSGLKEIYENLPARNKYIISEGDGIYRTYSKSFLICEGEIIEFNGRSYMTSGIYVDTLTNENIKEIVYNRIDVDNSCKVTGVSKPDNHMDIFPNPFNDKLIIHQKSKLIKSLKMFNISGVDMKVQAKWFPEKIIIDTEYLQKGIYILKIQDENGYSHFKMLK